jgi:hypothetical protein
MGVTACSGYQSNAVAIGDVKYGNCNTVVTVINEEAKILGPGTKFD